MNGGYTMRIVRFEEISSTNDYVKEQKKYGENLIVIAKRQTGGRGTKGRSFSSNEGGVYLTKLVFYKNFPAEKVFLVMARTAVAVCKTLESFGLKPVIKWANDVFINGRKICGILIENSFSGKEISSSIIGVGLNVNNSLPEELSNIAISMREAIGEKVDFDLVEKRLVENLNYPYDMSEYRSRVGYLNKEVTLIEGSSSLRVIPLSVGDDGALTVSINGELRKVFAGEVSLLV
ncbi:MAG: biotin--[Clostridia bacterium]|nr:biotin--[acetyl-CoA-carboxylase] ligase [Clostridia bacterium]